MTKLMIFVIVLVAFYVWFRLRQTKRRTGVDRSDQIQRKLEQLRKKRDEE